MSTKIYIAYKIPLSKFAIMSQLIRERMLNKVVRYINKELMGTVKYDYIVEKLEKFKKNFGKPISKRDEKKLWRSIQFDKLTELIMYFSRTPERNAFDIDCGLTFWIVKKFVYVIPYGEHRYTRTEGSETKYDFSYWNNTDEPKHISYKDWEQRGREWDKVLKLPHMYLPVVDTKADMPWESFVELKRRVIGALRHTNGHLEHCFYPNGDFTTWRDWVTWRHLTCLDKAKFKEIMSKITQERKERFKQRVRS